MLGNISLLKIVIVTNYCLLQKCLMITSLHQVALFILYLPLLNCCWYVSMVVVVVVVVVVDILEEGNTKFAECAHNVFRAR